jgi:hypothetical protein
LEKRTEQVLPRSEGLGEEMPQTMYAHMNKRIKKKKDVQ